MRLGLRILIGILSGILLVCTWWMLIHEGACKEVRIPGGGGDYVDICSLPNFLKEFTCFKKLKNYEASTCKFSGTECYTIPGQLGNYMTCIFTCCPELKSELFLKYHSHTPTSYSDITITQSKLIYTHFPESIAKERCKNWNKRYPCWKEEELKTMQLPLSKKEEEELMKFINKTNFLELPKAFYGNLTNSSGYYRLLIRMNGREKDVVYFESSATPMPEELRKIKDRLFELLERKSAAEQPKLSDFPEIFRDRTLIAIGNNAS